MRITDSATVRTSVGVVRLRKIVRMWYARKSVKGVRHEISLHTSDLDEARRMAAELMPAVVAGVVRFEHSEQSSPTEQHYATLFSKARARAKTNGVSYTITNEEQGALIERSGGLCELTGIPFSMARNPSSFRAPYQMSLDRINPEYGYTFANTRLVCVAVNWALSDWGTGVFDRICSHYIARKIKTSWG